MARAASLTLLSCFAIFADGGENGDLYDYFRLRVAITENRNRHLDRIADYGHSVVFLIKSELFSVFRSFSVTASRVSLTSRISPSMQVPNVPVPASSRATASWTSSCRRLLLLGRYSGELARGSPLSRLTSHHHGTFSN